MRWDGIIDTSELRKTIEVLKPDQQLFEVRIFGADKRKILSGYFTDCDTLISALDNVDLRGKNIYFTLNRVKRALYSRTQHDKFVLNVNTTSDSDIERYEWLFVDLDPERPADISSTDEELANALELSRKVQMYLHDMGFSDPVEAMSGNGHHLLYRIDLPCSDTNKQLLNDCLTVLASLFNNGDVKIDTVNFNPARICKLHGTLAQKGSNTKERPHRMSRLLSVPDQIVVNEKKLLKKLAEELPEEAKKPPQRSSRFSGGEFNIKEWMNNHGITYREEPGRDCQMYLLDECPFDSNHRNGDSKIFAYTNGAIAFKCHHNSCKNYKWPDVRLKFEPDAYDNVVDGERIEAGYQRHKKNKVIASESELIPMDGDKPKPKQKKVIRQLKTAEALMAKDIPDPEVYVGVGNDLPLLVEGTCILSAKPKLGKSWFALAMCLAVAKGEDFVGYRTKQCSTLYLDLETSEAIQKKRLIKALKGKEVPKNFYLETETDAINNGFVEQIEAYLQQDPNIGLVVVDVFQIIRSPAKNMKETEYEHAYRDITPLNELAQKHHISIILVCHDRKSVDPDDPFSNILGSTGLQGAATQMIVMFRKRKDDPVHISVKGKTIDGIPDFNVKLDDAEWRVVEGVSAEDRERDELIAQYRTSAIRAAVVELTNKQPVWQGRCSQLISDAIKIDIAITDSAKYVGGFLHRHQGRFLYEDQIKVEIISNGTGAKTYKIYKSTVDTVDEDEEIPLIDFENVSNYKGYEVPFL